MLVTEYPWNGRTDRIRYYSDDGHEIICNENQVVYGEVIAVYPPERTYSEAETYIPSAEATEQDYQEQLNRLGVDV